MAVTNEQIIEFLRTPNLTDVQIATAMQEYNVTPAQLAQAVRVPVEDVQERYIAAAPKTETAENINKLASQILAQGTTDIWTGGLPPEKAALYMASDLAKSGVTNIEQITKTDSGIVNSMTGEKLVSGYGERTGGNLWSGSYEGKGNTGFGVDFDAQGKPLFFTTAASSSDADQYMPIIQLALAATGAGGLLGNALLGAGANQIVAGALGGALLGGGTAAITGQDVLKGALTGGAGGAIAGYFSPSTGQITTTPVSADSVPFTGADYSLANGTQLNPLTDMGGAQGLQAGTSANLATMGGAQGITLNLGAPSLTLADAIATIGGANPANLTTMGGAQGLTYQTPTGLVTSTGTIPIGGLTGNNNVIGQTGINTATNIGSTIGTTIPTTVVTPPVVPPAIPPVVPPAPPVVPPVPPIIPPTITEIIKAIAPIAIPAIVATAVTPKTPTPTGFDIVPIPAEFKTPNAPTTAPYTPLTPIDFGTRELLRGTQFERFLDPNYGKVPEPVQYSQPSNMSYNDLMSILGSRQGMPSASSLSINDIISGIQNQYGQAPTRTMG